MVYGASTSEKRLAALIVDDDPIVRRIHKILLSKCGVETHIVENGKMAVDLFHYGAKFDLVLMDKDMPVMDGIQAMRMLRGMGVNTVIVGVTSRNLELEQQEFMLAGLNICLSKPLNAEAEGYSPGHCQLDMTKTREFMVVLYLLCQLWNPSV